MNVKNGKKACALFALIVWMALIFSFSAKPAVQSVKMSTSVGKKIGMFFVPDFKKRTIKEQEAFAEKIDYPVRKGAHACEYAVLGGLLFLNYCMYEKVRKKAAGLAILSGALYAASDEFHQLFVPGRSGQISDVVLDSCGVTVGVLFVGMIYFIWKRKKRT